MKVCSICGRPLKSPESVEAGMGPVCYRKTYGSTLRARRAKDTADNEAMRLLANYTVPGQISIEEYLREN